MSVLDRLLSRIPRGTPPGISNAGENITINEQAASERFVGLNPTMNAHRVNPYRIAPDRPASPPVILNGQFVPPGLRPHIPTAGSSRGLALGHLIAAGQGVRKGIAHPGRRLGHTGNPNVGVPGQH